jgi:hypothetical protein
MLYLTRGIERQIKPGPNPDLQHAAFGQRHDLFTLSPNRLGAAEQMRDSRHYIFCVKSHRYNQVYPVSKGKSTVCPNAARWF